VKGTLSPADLTRIVMASDPALLDDGSIVVRRATFDEAHDAIRGTLWQYGDGVARALTAGPDDRQPVLAPDRRSLAYVAGGAQICVLDPYAPAPEARAIGPLMAQIADLAWSPDGTRLAFTALVAPEPEHATIARDGWSGATHILALPHKDDARGLLDGRVRALYAIDVASGAVQRIAVGAADVTAPAWSPDGATIAFASLIGDPDTRMRGAISLVDVASGQVRRVTAGDGPAWSPAFSPDGQTIAYVGHQGGDDNRFNLEALVVPVSGGAPRSLTAALDRPVGNLLCGDVRSGALPRLAWLADGRELALLVTDGGACSLLAIAIADGAARTIAGGPRDISGFALDGRGAAAIVVSTPLEPCAIARIAADGREHLVASLNPWIDAYARIEPQRIATRADDGALLEAWLLAPPVSNAPLVLAVHPGPHAAFGWTFDLEFQLLAACGIGVVFGNPRGSLGYGNAFALGTTGDWGGGDMRDLLAILDAALERGSFDRTHLGVVGTSYGGFMVTWLLGHTDRFAAGVSLDAVNDFLALYGTSDVGWSMESEHAADVASDTGRALFERSALRAARAIVAPLLIVHSERDHRCPIDQAEALFATLRLAGKRDVEFVRLRGGGHELSRSGNPRERVVRLRAIANWFVRHLGGDANDASRAAGSLFRPLVAEAVR
jgi:dipeptidyl aminopeptidase/acylaminoacyl peptidase